MALPAAPLGQLPNMNMPYAIPTYQKPAGAFEKAITAFLVNVASQAGSKAVDNAMSTDYAPQMGEEVQPWYKKIFTGPTDDQSDFRQYNTINSAKDMQRAGFTNEASRDASAHEFDKSMADIAAERAKQAAVVASTNARIGEYDRAQNAKELAEYTHSLPQTPAEKAQTDYYAAQTDKLKAAAERQRQLIQMFNGMGYGNPNGTPTSAPPDAGLGAASAAARDAILSGKVPPSVSTQPPAQPVVDPQTAMTSRAMELLQQGMAPEDIAQKLQEEQDFLTSPTDWQKAWQQRDAAAQALKDEQLRQQNALKARANAISNQVLTNRALPPDQPIMTIGYR